MAFLAALLVGVSIGFFAWFIVSFKSEDQLIAERTQRFIEGGGAPKKGQPQKAEALLKAEFTGRKGTMRRLFDMTVVPSLKQWIFFTIIWILATFLILLKFQTAVIFKLILVGVVTLLLQRLLNMAAIKARLEELRKELPGALELVVICMEAGLSINASFLRVSNELKNSALGRELRQTFNEIQAGSPLEEALQSFAKRTNLPEVRSVVVAIIQAQKMGTPISGTLRVQVESLREKMKMKMKEEIMRVPVKILFPLVFFIFPVLFIIILGPAAIDIFKNLTTSAE